MLDLPGATLVFGILRAASAEEQAKIKNASPVPFIHAWVEYDDEVYAPTLIERMNMTLAPHTIDDYYGANAITTTWRLSHAQFTAIAQRFDLSAAFLARSDSAAHSDVSTALLMAAGVEFTVSSRNTILPAQK